MPLCNRILLLFLILCSSCFIIGCSVHTKNSSSTTIEMSDANDNKPLKIMYHSSSRFYKDYGNLFELNYPPISIEVVPIENISRQHYDLMEWLQFIHDQEVDVVAVPFELYEDLVKERELTDLQPYIQRDAFDIAKFVPAVIQILQQAGGKDTLYGMTVSFTSRALMYNRSLFDQINATYPKNNMTWEEVLQLARQFPNQLGIYGLAGPNVPIERFNPFSFVQTITQTEGLEYFIPDIQQHVKNNETYTSLFRIAMQAIQDGIIYHPYIEPQLSFENQSGTRFYANHLFTLGRAAMSHGDYYLYLDLMKQDGLVSWDIVTEPVSSFRQPVSYNYSLNKEIWGIPVHSKHDLAAWEFIKFVHSEETSRARQFTQSNQGFPSLVSQMLNDPDKNMQAFYLLNPVHPDRYYVSLDMNEEIRREAINVLLGNRMIEEAISYIAAKIEEDLERTREEEQ